MKYYLTIDPKEGEIIEVEAESKESAWQKLFQMVERSKSYIRENTVSEEEARYNSYE